MKKLLLFMFLGTIVTSCFKEVTPEKTITKLNVVVEELFIHDGIKVYRFEDNGKYQIFKKLFLTI